MKGKLERIRLQGLELAPAQGWRGVRIAPILRRQAPGDLRIAARSYRSPAVVQLEGEAPRRRRAALPDELSYVGYVPHGYVIAWDEDGAPLSAPVGQLAPRDNAAYAAGRVRVFHRMAKRTGENSLRLLPLHLAMEGFLARHFGGPDIAFTEYSKRALRSGLDPRMETVFPGAAIDGLQDALRVFEIHEDQVGALIFVADALASAFVVSHPDDYRRLHRSLIEDFYGELLVHYGRLGVDSPMFASMNAEAVHDLEGLAAQLDMVRAAWAEMSQAMSAGLLDRSIESERIFSSGPFRLYRFTTDLSPSSGEDHIGEAIVRQDGTLEYLKSYRLSHAQVRRAYLLSVLAKARWNLEVAARAEGQSKADLILRLERAGFDYLLTPEVRAASRRGRA